MNLLEFGKRNCLVMESLALWSVTGFRNIWCQTWLLIFWNILESCVYNAFRADNAVQLGLSSVNEIGTLSSNSEFAYRWELSFSWRASEQGITVNFFAGSEDILQSSLDHRLSREARKRRDDWVDNMDFRIWLDSLVSASDILALASNEIFWA